MSADDIWFVAGWLLFALISFHALPSILWLPFRTLIRSAKGLADADEWPLVSVIVAARDEEARAEIARHVGTQFAPVVGLQPGEQLGPLIDDRRFLVFRPQRFGLWLVDPATGQRDPVALQLPRAPRISSIASRACSSMEELLCTTCSGAPVAAAFATISCRGAIRSPPMYRAWRTWTNTGTA